MKKLGIILIIAFLFLVAVYFFIFKPDKYVEPDLYEQIMQRGILKVGINTDSKPFGFYDENGRVIGYDADLGRYIAQYLLNNPNKVIFIPVTPSNRMLKASTGEVDIVIATMTITPQRHKIIEFSIPYDSGGQAVLVKSNSKVTSITDLAGLNVGVIWGTTAEKNMLKLVPTANIIGFKNYQDAYKALKDNKIQAITSDDTILNRFVTEDKGVKLLSKRYSREPYGIGFRKGKGSAMLKENIDSAVRDMKQKNIINRLRNKWLAL